MRKTFTMALLCAAAAMVSCKKDNASLLNGSVQDNGLHKIELSIPDSRVGFGEDGLSVTWKENDNLLLLNFVQGVGMTSSDVSIYELLTGADTKSATFQLATGAGAGIEAGKKYILAHSGLFNQMDSPAGKLVITPMAPQVQLSAADFSHVNSNIIYTCSDLIDGSAPDYSSFASRQSVLELRLSLAAASTAGLSQIKVKAPGQWFVKSQTYELDGTKTNETTDELTLDFAAAASLSTNASAPTVARMLVWWNPEITNVSGQVQVTLTTDDSQQVVVPFTPTKAWVAGSKYNMTLAGITGLASSGNTVPLDKLYGYATLAGGTTGGAGATAANTHHFDNGAKLQTWLLARQKIKSAVPAIVYLSGTFNKTDGRAASSPWFDVKRTSNITFIGLDDFRMKGIGFFLVEATNIVIRNVYIEMPKADNGADGISMQDSHNVWVDHCTFQSMNQTKDYEDGSCDVTHASYNATISWCHFINTQKTCLIGHSDGASADVQITATLHHNFFDGSSSRHPRVRYGRAHVYNNYYNGVTTYGAGSAYGAMVLVENNYFRAVHLPTDICTFPAKKSGSSWVSNLTGKVAGYLYDHNNYFTEKPDNASDPYPFTNVEYPAYGGTKNATAYTYNDFKPSYQYDVDNQEQINTIVPAGAGVGKLGYTTAPIPVDNAGIADGETGGGDGGGGDDDPGTVLGGGWTAKEFGTAAGQVVTGMGGDAISVTGQGKFESGAQTFNFVYREVTGDFTFIARLDSYTQVTSSDSNQGQGGLMMVNSLTATANDLLHMLCGRSATTYYYSRRVTAGSTAGKGSQPAPANIPVAAEIEIYMKLVRSGNSCAVCYSLDGGETWGAESTGSFTSLPETVYVGFGVNSANTSKTATATFSDVTLNGTSMRFED